jgi:hypothetical protein
MQKNEPERALFVVGCRYRNRKGEYEVLRIQGDKLHIRYDDGTVQELSASIQARIAQNMSIEAASVTPYPTTFQARNDSFFYTLGFLAIRATMLEAIVPSHALGGFTQDYARIKGNNPNPKQPGLYIHQKRVDKWGCELRVTFRARGEELVSLDFGPDVHCVDDPSNPGVNWRINNNGFWWKLLKLGFEMGPKQSDDGIKSRIPFSCRNQFDLGIKRAEI